jgi:hypothetical protein
MDNRSQNNPEVILEKLEKIIEKKYEAHMHKL